MTDDAYSLQRLADRTAINDALIHYCRGVDRKDWKLGASAYHPDAYDEHGSYKGGVEGLFEWIRQRHRTILVSTHQLTNVLIEFAGPDLALCESYFIGYQRYSTEGEETRRAIMGGVNINPDDLIDLMFFGRYIDRFERRQGRWAIARRTVATDSTIAMVVPPHAPKPAPDWCVGKRDGTDIVETERMALGII